MEKRVCIPSVDKRVAEKIEAVCLGHECGCPGRCWITPPQWSPALGVAAVALSHPVYS